MARIESIQAREILDSRGRPTLEVDLVTDEGLLGRAAVPSGASTGSREALELRDGDKKRYFGKGVLRAVRNVKELIAPKLLGMDPSDPQAVDRTLLDLDGTENKSKLGANAVLGVSLAAVKAGAASNEAPLHAAFGDETLFPCPFVNVVNGGAHADNSLDFQEFMLVPGGFDRFSEALRAVCEAFQALKEILKSKGLSTAVGDEGGFAPNLKSTEEALEVLLAAVSKAGYKEGKQIALALDVAATEFFRDGAYRLERAGREADAEGLVELYGRLCEAYPILSIEDGLAEEDWEGWEALTQELGDRIQLVGDDLFVTHAPTLQKAIDRSIGSAILIKLNQVGTVTETLEAIRLAHGSGYGAMISHRSGETEDTTIAHLAVGSGAGMIKTGSVTRGERTAKYNELLRLEETLGDRASYAGFSKLSRRS